jgi:hypothetical protein
MAALWEHLSAHAYMLAHRFYNFVLTGWAEEGMARIPEEVIERLKEEVSLQRLMVHYRLHLRIGITPESRSTLSFAHTPAHGPATGDDQHDREDKGCRLS